MLLHRTHGLTALTARINVMAKPAQFVVLMASEVLRRTLRVLRMHSLGMRWKGCNRCASRSSAALRCGQ